MQIAQAQAAVDEEAPPEDEAGPVTAAADAVIPFAAQTDFTEQNSGTNLDHPRSLDPDIVAIVCVVPQRCCI